MQQALTIVYLPVRLEIDSYLFLGVIGMSDQTSTGLREEVRSNYAAAARAVLEPGAGVAASCCGGSAADSCCGGSAAEAVGGFSENLYREGETDGLPEEAVLVSLGCGNPLAVADLHEGERVLDLGSGGGIDVLLSAKRVGSTGKAYGLDMTDEMLALARDNQQSAGVTNVEFLKGEMESIPLPANSVDVIISNCVINLSADKERVLGETFRVLKPGGRLAVSDVVARGEVPAEVRQSMLLWVGCIAGALKDSEYNDELARAGFVDIRIKPTRVYSTEDARAWLASGSLDVDSIAPQVEGKFMSAFIAREHGQTRSSYKTSRSLPSRRVMCSRSRYSSSGIAYFRETPVQSLNAATLNRVAFRSASICRSWPIAE